MTIFICIEHGNLPLLVINPTSITSINVVESIPGISSILLSLFNSKCCYLYYDQGTKEEIACSDRGICNEATGLCKCFKGYSSSNGMGGLGTIADCGYIEPGGTPDLFAEV